MDKISRFALLRTFLEKVKKFKNNKREDKNKLMFPVRLETKQG